MTARPRVGRLGFERSAPIGIPFALGFLGYDQAGVFADIQNRQADIGGFRLFTALDKCPGVLAKAFGQAQKSRS
jgi:hypothetical protein